MRRRGNGNDEEIEVAASAPSATEESAADEEATAPTEASPGGLEPHASDAEPSEPPQDALAELRRERDELKEALLRRRADFENFRKRVERDRGTAALEAEAGVLRQLLGTVDNLERALAAHDAATALREGVVLTHRELMALLESLGVTVIDALGQRFDPAEHQAILHEPAPGFEPGTVCEVYRKGYRYRDRLLRPALVKVASEASEANVAGGDGGDVQ